ncbi:conserved Plasmodium protein, unknown function [Plasmodium vivax]|uniref:Protein phosphatase 2C n=6 Tax=Plasmodium vivax TaxID=5855 RepID=A5KAN5_PLAVS|nr:hypothetical protein, conserved [Plasmodium vivax]KMZ82619.1 protein phosphatase 2C [Plasmodium vivax India VII]KMZ89012.1 protein phosphatase 2C, variant [Plasmodium vivax Brazil I]KMZ95423.1 protein phosphatase 2C, variant [Plasmodium vivax Mauritania I]KNA01902.1 protein phosphatase 2C, variant [Plasmodium vivax North Korean]EDL43634.1 hypothetical protein, conserved [Plasmodium vivax]|eukprot:XP_001613361.1 hypothetical protein [Plasmodium vivax Sal-1]
MKELVGRSRNERKLDGIYNKQRDALLHQYKNERERNKDIYANLNKRKANETIPFPEIYEKKRKADKPKVVDSSKEGTQKGESSVKGEEQPNRVDDSNAKNKRSNSSITLFKGIHMIIYRHIFSKSKFVKSVTLFINLCINYLNNQNKNVFFFAFDKIVRVFLRNYIHDDEGQTASHSIYTVYSEDELHIKCMVSLFDKVINRIIDNRFRISANACQSEEAANDDGHSVNTDGATNEAPDGGEGSGASQHNAEEDTPKQRSSQAADQPNTVVLTKQERKYLKALKIRVYYLIILYKLNDNFIFNKLISIYRQILEELLREYEQFEEAVSQERRRPARGTTGGANVTSTADPADAADPANPAAPAATMDDLAEDEDFLHLQEKWTLPSDYELFKIKRSAFVKCMSKVFHFIHVKWASTLVESLLLDVYFKKHIFDTCDEILIEKLQSAAKGNMNKRKTPTHSPHVLSIGESLNPVVDARAEKIVSLHGSHVWSTKQMER